MRNALVGRARNWPPLPPSPTSPTSQLAMGREGDQNQAPCDGVSKLTIKDSFERSMTLDGGLSLLNISINRSNSHWKMETESRPTTVAPFEKSVLVDLDYESDETNQNSESILFIHSLGESRMERGSTVRYIAKKRCFHYLLPSLQAHQISNLDYCVELLAACIHFEAKGGVAHVVGLSIGAHIAILLANRHPRLVKTLNLSGYNGFSPLTQRLLPFGIRLISSFSFQECRGITKTLLSSNKVGPLPIRKLINVGLHPIQIAGVYLGTHDDPKVAKKLARRLSDNGSKVSVKGGNWMKHRWNIQYADVYAEVILAWIDDVEWLEIGGISFQDL
jgi:hypothetical protein